MRVVGPNALGVANTDPEVRLNATLAADDARGRAASASSASPARSASPCSPRRRERGLGLSTFVSAGNRADLSGNDLLQYWETDPATDVVLLYLESFGNPRKFARLARRLARTQADRGGEERPVDRGVDAAASPGRRSTRPGCRRCSSTRA